MGNKYLSFIIALISLSVVQVSKAQTLSPEVIATDGGYAVSSQGSLSWTMGEVIVETVSSSSNILTQGFQQPEDGLLTVVENTQSSIITTVYPNPANEIIYLLFQPDLNGNYNINLFNAQGKLLKSASTDFDSDSNTFSLSLSDLQCGLYFLTVSSDDNIPLQSFQISKVH